MPHHDVGEKLLYLAGLLPDDDDDYTSELTRLSKKAIRTVSILFIYNLGEKAMVGVEAILKDLDSIIAELEALDEN